MKIAFPGPRASACEPVTPGSFRMQLETPVFHYDNVITEPH